MSEQMDMLLTRQAIREDQIQALQCWRGSRTGLSWLAFLCNLSYAQPRARLTLRRARRTWVRKLAIVLGVQ